MRTLKDLSYYSYEIFLIICATDERKSNAIEVSKLLMINVASPARNTQNVNIREKLNEALCTKYPCEKVSELIEQL